ncbi:MAG: isocitrate lyase/PEP mutase family protein [Desulfobacterales bacterium]|jgi:2-methylisocitrate lyase-like PEP mutase family enzyme
MPDLKYMLEMKSVKEVYPLTGQSAGVARLRKLLEAPEFIIMPCCYDGISAKLIQQCGYSLTFMSGFAVSAARLGLPDTGLISYAEMLDQGRNICSAVDIPVIGDGDTGYGNTVNVKRTVHGYIQAGFAGIMIEDQRSPKRCGHTTGKEVVEREEALLRIRAVIEARDEARDREEDIVIVSRTDARDTHGLSEAIERAKLFVDMGADIIFIESPRSEEEMYKICSEVGGCQMANILEYGNTPVLPPELLKRIGYKIAAYPLTLLSSALYAMREALYDIREGKMPERILDFRELQAVVGFPEYDNTLRRLEGKKPEKDH